MTTLAATTTQYIDVPLTAYEAYDPCRFAIPNEAVSGAISVNDTVGEEQQALSFDNAAPVGDLKVSLQSSAATIRYSTAVAWLVVCIDSKDNYARTSFAVRYIGIEILVT